jgi:hypothetical protein
MPGTSPRIANSRSLLRDRPNLRKNPRGRPVIAQRLRRRVPPPTWRVRAGQ